MNLELVRIIEGIAKEKRLVVEEIYAQIERAIESAIRRSLNRPECAQIIVTFDKKTGALRAQEEGPTGTDSFEKRRRDIPEAIIVGAGAKEVILDIIRGLASSHEPAAGAASESPVLSAGMVVSGLVIQSDRGAIIVDLGACDAILPTSEQVAGTKYRKGEAIDAMVIEVRFNLTGTLVILSQRHPELYKQLALRHARRTENFGPSAN